VFEKMPLSENISVDFLIREIPELGVEAWSASNRGYAERKNEIFEFEDFLCITM
jgi:hypothetical protein